MEIKENERIDELGIKDLKIIQNKEWFCFGIDSVLLVNFAKKYKKRCKCFGFRNWFRGYAYTIMWKNGIKKSGWGRNTKRSM